MQPIRTIQASQTITIVDIQTIQSIHTVQDMHDVQAIQINWLSTACTHYRFPKKATIGITMYWYPQRLCRTFYRVVKSCIFVSFIYIFYFHGPNKVPDLLLVQSKWLRWKNNEAELLTCT